MFIFDHLSSEFNIHDFDIRYRQVKCLLFVSKIKFLFTITILTQKITKMKIENERILLNELDENLRALMIVPSYKLGAYTFNVETRVLSFNGEDTKLTRKETYLFVLFAANANSMLDRKYMLTTIWKDDNYYNSRSMDVYICKLRKLLSKDPNITIINIHGKGYRIIVS